MNVSVTKIVEAVSEITNVVTEIVIETMTATVTVTAAETDMIEIDQGPGQEADPGIVRGIAGQDLDHPTKKGSEALSGQAML